MVFQRLVLMKDIEWFDAFNNNINFLIHVFLNNSLEYLTYKFVVSLRCASFVGECKSARKSLNYEKLLAYTFTLLQDTYCSLNAICQSNGQCCWAPASCGDQRWMWLSKPHSPTEIPCIAWSLWIPWQDCFLAGFSANNNKRKSSSKSFPPACITAVN